MRPVEGQVNSCILAAGICLSARPRSTRKAGGDGKRKEQPASESLPGRAQPLLPLRRNQASVSELPIGMIALPNQFDEG